MSSQHYSTPITLLLTGIFPPFTFSVPTEIAVVSYEPDDDVKEKKLVTLNNEVIPFYLEKLEMIAKENSGHLALGKLTWADFYFAGIIDYLNYMTKTNLVEKYPSLQKTLDNVMQLEQIKAWVEKRPVTEV